MRFRAEAKTLYYKANHLGKKNRRYSEKHGSDPYVLELQSVLDENMVADTVDVGVLDIPTTQIVGTASAEGRTHYTKDFLPLNPTGSEFADQWCALYQHYLCDEGMRVPITCYEYMGRFYVLDGKKRVSILKSHGVSAVHASVTRILPKNTEDEEVQNYYEFLEAFEKTRLYQVKFTRPNSFPKFQKALGYDKDHVWTEGDRFDFIFNWHRIEDAFQYAFGGYINITTADALLTLMEDYSYDQIRKTPTWILARFFQTAWKKLYTFQDSDADFDLVENVKSAS